VQLDAPPVPGTVIAYRQVNGQRPSATVPVAVAPADLARFAADGYLVVPDVLGADLRARLGAALLALVEHEFVNGIPAAGGAYDGRYLRGLLDKDRAFHALIDHPVTTPIVRAMLGPRVQIRSFTGRVTYPGTGHASRWHVDQPSWVDPAPPFFSYPQIINVIYLLDDVTAANGPLLVVPGSHRSPTPPPAEHGDLPGQVALTAPAGSAILIHGALWHRGGANGPGGALRRVLLVDHNPVWMKTGPFDGYAPAGGHLTRPLIERGDATLRDLLGEGGWY